MVAVRSHPRHLVVGCLVAGLLAFGSRAVVLAAAALAAVLAGRRTPLGPVAAAVVLAGALLAQPACTLWIEPRWSRCWAMRSPFRRPCSSARDAAPSGRAPRSRRSPQAEAEVSGWS